MIHAAHVAHGGFGPIAFWREIHAVFASRKHRTHLTWDEWDRIIAAAEKHGLFDRFENSPDAFDLRSFVHPNAVAALMPTLSAVAEARDLGEDAKQWALNRDARIDYDRAESRERLRDVERSVAAQRREARARRRSG
jgi:hypothetical protein